MSFLFIKLLGTTYPFPDDQQELLTIPIEFLYSEEQKARLKKYLTYLAAACWLSRSLEEYKQIASYTNKSSL